MKPSLKKWRKEINGTRQSKTHKKETLVNSCRKEDSLGSGELVKGPWQERRDLDHK